MHQGKGNMEKTYLNNLVQRYPSLVECYDDIFNATDIMLQSFKNNKKLLVAGNGGSAADALHIVGELMKSFVLPRKLEKSIVNSIDKNCKHNNYLKSNLQCILLDDLAFLLS